MVVKMITNKSRIALLVLAVFLLAWPPLIDQNAMQYWISPYNGDAGGSIAFALKLASLILGGALISLRIDSNRIKNWQLWAIRIFVALVISGLLFVVTYLADFARDFVW
jgi:hypothetical protein